MTPLHKFPIMEIFGPTIQGEGALAGHLTHFVRFGGCGHRCSWCDTMFAVDPRQVRENRIMMDAIEIASGLNNLSHAPWVTFSGGDPCLQKDMDQVIDKLEPEYMLAVETQGAVWQDWLKRMDLVTLSPKGPSSGMEDKIGDFHTILSELSSVEDTEVVLKIVVDVANEADFQFALARMEDFRDIMPEHHPCYLQPCSPVDPTKSDEHKTLAILDRYRMLCERVFDAIAADELPVSDLVVLPQIHTITWPDKDKGI